MCLYRCLPWLFFANNHNRIGKIGDERIRMSYAERLKSPRRSRDKFFEDSLWNCATRPSPTKELRDITLTGILGLSFVQPDKTTMNTNVIMVVTKDLILSFLSCQGDIIHQTEPLTAYQATLLRQRAAQHVRRGKLCGYNHRTFVDSSRARHVSLAKNLRTSA